MPEISVIVPVYKAESYLRDCIGSLLDQTFGDFEILLVDDGSPDRCGDICEEYALKDSRITVIHQENRGQAAARNHALRYAKGSWVCFVDSDDLIHPQTLQLLHRAAVESGASVSMCRMLEAPELSLDFYQEKQPGHTLLTMDEETLVAMHDREEYPAWVACGKLIRKELVENYPFREGRVFEDNEAVCRWVCQGKTLAMVEEKLYFYRTNPGSTTKSDFSLKKLDYLWALESILKYYSSLGYLQMRQRFFDRYVHAVVSACNGLRYVLFRPELVRGVEKDFFRVCREEGMRVNKQQFEALLDSTHPKLMKLYWPVDGVIQTLKRQGISGIGRKLSKRLRKDDDQ